MCFLKHFCDTSATPSGIKRAKYMHTIYFGFEELDGAAVSMYLPRRTIAKAKQQWPVIEWVTKNLLSQAPSCF
jgi:hypothetical protein